MINSERICLPLASRLVAATTDRNAKSVTITVSRKFVSKELVDFTG